MFTSKKSLATVLTASVCLSMTGALTAQAAEPTVHSTSSISSSLEALPQSDITLLNRISAIDVEHASDAELNFLGFTADRDRSGNIIAYRMNAETRAQMEHERMLVQANNRTASSSSVQARQNVVQPMGGVWNWAKCTAQLGAFVVSYVIPAGRAGAIAVKAIGIIKRRGIKKTIDILKRYRSLKGVEAKDAADLIAAIVGLDFLEPCKAALGI